MAASSRRIASVASARTAMIASAAPIAKAAMAAPSMTAYGSRSSRYRSVRGRRVRAVAVGHDVAARRLGRRRRAATSPPVGKPAPPRPRRPDAAIVGDRRGRPEVADRPSQAVERAGPHRRVEVGRVRGAGALEQDRRPGGRGLEAVRPSVRRLRRPRPVPARARRARRRGRRGRSPRAAGARRPRRPARVAVGRLEAQVAVVRRRAVDHRVPRAGQLADPLERGDRQVAVGRLGRLEDREHLAPGRGRTRRGSASTSREVDRRERPVGRVRDRPAGAAQRRFLAPLAVGLGRAPVDVVAAARVDAAHVDALDRAGLGALEAGLALERAPLVVEELEPAAELVRDVEPHLGVHDRDLRLEEAAQGQAPCP